MSAKTFHYCWEWALQAPPEALWPHVSNTNRFNRDTGLAPLDLNQPRQTGLGRHLRLHMFGLIPIEWEEEPFQWVYGRSFGVVRRYLKGPVREMHVLAELSPSPSGGTHLRYQVWATPQNWLGWLAIPMQIGWISARTFGRVFGRYDEQLRDDPMGLDAQATPVRLEPSAAERLAAARRQLLAEGQPADLIDRLWQVITQADELTVSELRPYQWADRWGVSRRALLELCLQATRAGVLDFEWQLLCPLCRGAGSNVGAHLHDLHATVHCDSCQIDYTANFERSVEVTFRPSPAIRRVERLGYCVAGPQITPHVVVQQVLAPQAHLSVPVTLALGRYRLRTDQLPAGQALIVAESGGRPQLTLAASAAGWPDDEKMLPREATLRLENQTAEAQRFVLEQMAWSDQAVTAAEITTLQKFRDLFASEALRPGEQFAVGNVAILFTDLVDSTRLYNEIGDAPAFGLVLNHFDILKQTIDEAQGAIVKTIGDAVMAVFQRPLAAFEAISRAQALLSQPAEGTQPLALKAGIHYGPCIVVTLNEQLDYFGSTVNMAARLEKFAVANAVVVTAAVRHDPEMVAFLQQGKVAIESFTAHLKGFESGEVQLWRLAAVWDSEKGDENGRT